MLGSLLYNLIALFFSWMTSVNTAKLGLKLAVFTLFVFLSIRYDYGNDYLHYLEIFKEITFYDKFSLDNYARKGNEVGWIFLNYLFKPLGFFWMQVFLAGFSCFILYRFIKKYVHQKYLEIEKQPYLLNILVFPCR